jgi:hypothetical protein
MGLKLLLGIFGIFFSSCNPVVFSVMCEVVCYWLCVLIVLICALISPNSLLDISVHSSHELYFASGKVSYCHLFLWPSSVGLGTLWCSTGVRVCGVCSCTGVFLNHFYANHRFVVFCDLVKCFVRVFKQSLV